MNKNIFVIIYDGLDNDGKVGMTIAKMNRDNTNGILIPLDRDRLEMSAPIWEDKEFKTSKFDLNICRDADVIMVDIALTLEEMDRIDSISKTFKCFDHHQIGEEMIGRSYMNHSFTECGTSLIWNFYNPDKENILVEYVKDRDLWIKKLKGVDQIFRGLILAEDKDVIDALKNNTIDKIMEIGKAPHQEYMEKVEEGFKSLVVKNWGKHTVGYAENLKGGIISDVGARACKEMPVDFFVCKSQLDDGAFQYSLRSNASKEKVFDTSIISKLFGGGGHIPASGFNSYLDLV